MELDDHETRTVFRRWPDGSIIALFPDTNAGNGHCDSYMHVGQHGGADYTHVVSRTKPAAAKEYADLLTALTSLGYRVAIRSRCNRTYSQALNS